MTSKADNYIKKTEAIIAQMTEKNREYFSNLQYYMILSSLIVDEKEVREQIYNMSLDLLDAEKNNLSAESYFGKNPKAMADDLIKQTKPEPLWKTLAFIVTTEFFGLGSFSLYQFSNSGSLDINILSFFIWGLLGFLFIIFLFYLLKNSVYSQFSKRITYLATSVIIIFLLVIAFSFNILSHIGYVITISQPYDWLIIGCFFLLLLSYARKIPYFRPLFPPALALFFNGMIKRYYLLGILQGELWQRWLPLLLLLISIIAFYIWLYLLLKKSK